jgi:hypothetical protein
MYTQKKYTRDGEAAMNHKPEGLFKLVATDLYVPGVFPPEGSEKVRQAAKRILNNVRRNAIELIS